MIAVLLYRNKLKNPKFWKMFSFVNAFEDDERGIEGSKILTVTSMFNNKIRAKIKLLNFEMKF